MSAEQGAGALVQTLQADPGVERHTASMQANLRNPLSDAYNKPR